MSEIQNMTKEELIELLKSDMQKWNNFRKESIWPPNLRGANLRGAKLWSANLRGANLWGANLENLEHINVNSHDLLAEFLRRSAEDDWQKRSIAGLILVSRDWCYKDLLKLPVPEELKQWAIEVLSKYPDFEERLERE